MASWKKTGFRHEIIGAACGWGAQDRRCAMGPEALHRHPAYFSLKTRLTLEWEATLHHAPGTASSLFGVAELCERLARRVERACRHGRIPLVLGGDHSIAIGTWSGVKQALDRQASLGLIWIDAHLDSHTPQTSQTQAIHGMPLAVLLGKGDPALTRIGGSAPPINPEHVCIVGVRSHEPGELTLLQDLGVRIIFMDEINRRGLEAVLAEALAIATHDTAGYGLSLDLDAIDPEDAPGVGSPEPGGIRGTELTRALAPFRGDPRLLAMEIAEYNPALDVDHRTATLTWDLVTALLGLHLGSDPTELEAVYGARNYHPLPVTLVRGEGVLLWDDQGKRYLDFMSAYSAVSHGHAHPRLLGALEQQARRLAVTSRAFHNDRLGPFLARLCELTGMARALPMNTGAEAVETALKAARKWAYQVKGVPGDRARIIACKGNFHGRTLAIVGMSSEPQYRDGFGPFPDGFDLIDYGDTGALERAITPETAAFLVEPIQGEGGIIVPPPGYLARCAELCRRHQVLLITDEIQTGLGRTGKLLASWHEDVQPDGVTLGKALGGGLLPVSAFLAREEVMAVFTPGDHGSTFGGNALAAAVGLEALNVLVEEGLPERAAELGEYLMARLRELNSPLVLAVRGRGLLVGMEINPDLSSAREICEKLMHRGILTKDTHGTVIRLAPPLIITRSEIDFAVEQIGAALKETESAWNRAA
jgi:ornithine--oxo-acid transaminase